MGNTKTSKEREGRKERKERKGRKESKERERIQYSRYFIK